MNTPSAFRTWLLGHVSLSAMVIALRIKERDQQRQRDEWEQGAVRAALARVEEPVK